MKNQKTPGYYCLLTLACLAVVSTRAATVTWINTAGGSWGVAANWSPHQIPGAADTALITANGTYGVTLSGNVKVGNLTLGGASGQQTLTTGGNTLTLNQAAIINSNGLVQLNGGELLGNVTLSGQLNWTAGQLGDSDTALTVATNGMLVLAGTMGTDYTLGEYLTNAGTINLQSGNLLIDYNNWAGDLINLPGGLVDIQADVSIDDSADINDLGFVNEGTARKSGGTGVTAINSVFNNTGTLLAQTGTLQLNHGGDLGGNFQTATGAAINVNSGDFLGSGVWAGTVNWSPGTADLTGTLLVATNGVLNVGGGDLTVAALVAGTLNWTGGTLATNGSLTVATNGVLNIGASLTLQGPLTNNGTVNWQGGYLQLNYDGLDNLGGIWNQPGAQWNVQCDQTLYDWSGEEAFNNAGTLTKSLTTGTTLFNVALNNTGTVQAQSGTIQMANGGALGGSFQANAGTTIYISGGNFNWDGTVIFLGPGAVQITGGTVTVTRPVPTVNFSGVTISGLSNVVDTATLNNCTISDLETITGTVNWRGGTLAAAGALTVATNGVLNLQGSFNDYGPFTNWGTVNWQAGTVQLYYDGTSYFGEIWNQAGGVWNLQCSQSLGDWSGQEQFNNAGVVSKSQSIGTSSFNVGFANSGTVVVQTGTIALQNGGRLGGQFSAAANAAMVLGGPFSGSPAGGFNGAGSFTFSSGSLTLFTNVMANLQMNGGTVYLDPSFQNGVITNLTLTGASLGGTNTLLGDLTLNNASLNGALTVLAGGVLTGNNLALNGLVEVGDYAVFTWAGGNMSAIASVLVGAGGVLNITGSLSCSGPLINEGTVNWQGGNLQLYYNGSSSLGEIWNQPGAQWNLLCNQSVGDWSGQERFNNAGDVLKTNSTGTTTFNVLFDNSGTVEAQSGTIDLNNGGNVFGGNLLADLNGSILLGGNYDVGPGISLSGAGSFQFNSGTLTLFTNVVPNLQLTGGTVYLDSSFQGGTITNLTLNGSSLGGTNSVSGSLTGNNASLVGSLTVLPGAVLTGNSLALDGPVVVDNAGVFNWAGGALGSWNQSGTASLLVATGAVLNFQNSVSLWGALTNQGTVNWQGGNLQLYYDDNENLGEIWNLAGAQWNLLCNQSLGDWSGQEQFNNAGSVLKTNSVGTTTFSVMLDNTGTVEAQSGIIDLNNGGSSLGGNFMADVGAAIDFSGNFVLGPWVNLGGAGSFQFNSGTLTLVTNGVPNLQLTGGTVSLDPSFQGGTITNLTLNGATLSGTNTVSGSLTVNTGTLYGSLTVLSGGVFNWAGGELASWEDGGSSSLSVAAGGTLNIQASIACLSPFTNAGTVNWQGGSVQLYYDGNANLGEIWNQPGGIWNLQCDQTLNDWTGQEQFNNAGNVLKTNSVGTTTFSVMLDNTGTVEAQSGTIDLNNGGSSLGGNFMADVGAAIDFSGNFVLGPWVNLGGAGSFQFNSGTLTLVTNGVPNLQLTGGTVSLDPSFQGGTITNLTLNGATLSGTNTVSGSLTVNTGTLYGSLTVMSGGVFNWAGGELASWEDGGSSSLSVAAGGTLNIQASIACLSPFTNAGTVNWQGGSVQLYFDGNANLGEIWNQPGGIWNLQCDQTLNDWTGQEQFNNAGTVVKTNSYGATGINIIFDNSGTVLAQSGTINLQNGGSILAGNLIADPNAAINLGGDYAFGPEGSFSGGGSIQFTSGNLTLFTNVSPNLQLVGGTVYLDPSFQGGTITNLTLSGATLGGTNAVSGLLTVNSGTLIGSLTVLTGGMMNLEGGMVIGGVVTNEGTVNWQGGAIYTYYNGSGYLAGIWNQPGGIWNLQCDQMIYNPTWWGAYPVPFYNAGIVSKNQSYGTSTFENYVNFDNVGTLDVQSGAITLDGMTLLETSGTLSFGISGLFDYGSIYIPGIASPLNGLISANFINGYVPVVGDTFTPLAFDADTGVFSGLDLPEDVSWQTNYSSTAFSLTVLQGLELLPIPTQFVAGGTALTVTAAVADSEVPPDALTYSLAAAPAGMTINPGSGVIHWTAPNAAVTNAVVVNVTDNGTPPLQASLNFAVVVVPTHGNSTPVLPVIPTLNVAEQTLLSVTNTATEADPFAVLAYSLVSAPAGAAIDANGVVTWTPGQNQSPGTNVFVVAVTNTDAFASGNAQLGATNRFLVIVQEVNVAPVLPVMLTQTINQYTPLAVTNAASEENIHATLAYGLAGAPAGMTINSSGVIAWTPTLAQTPGSYLITTIVANTDLLDPVTPHLTATNLFLVVVTDVNGVPVLGTIPNRSVHELALLAVTNAATETDGHATLTYALLNPPAGAAINPTNGVITWTPAQTESPGTNQLTTVVTSTDVADPVNPFLTATNAFSVVVAEINVAPVFSTQPTQTVNELTLLTVTNAASDANIHATLAYRLVNPPTGAVIDTNGVITWTPGQTQSPGTNTLITVATASDVFDAVNPQLSATNTVTVIVREVNVAPTLPVLAPASVNELTLLTLTNAATETDIHATLAYGLVGAPAGMHISGGGVITWTPAQPQSPSTNVITTIVTNTDAFDLVNPHFYATNSFTVIVHEVNAAPTLPVLSSVTVNELTLLTVTNTAVESNIHAATTSYSLVNPPAGMTISSNGVIIWTPAQTQSPSTNTIVTVVGNLDALDPVNPALTATNSFTVVVKEVNVAPVLPSLAPQTVNELTLLTVTNTATDASVHATVGYALLNPPTGAAISPNGVITWTPGQNQSPGTYTVATVAAGTNNWDQIHPQLSVTNSFSVTVEEVNVAPTLPVIATQTVNELTLLTVTNTAGESNIHATNLTYSLLNPPAGAAISTNGIIMWTPSQAQSPGTNTITTVVVNDDPYDPAAAQLAAVNSFTVIVKEVNVAPVLPVIAPQTVNELTLLMVTNTATESNLHATVGYALLVAPTGVVITTNGIITWTPGQNQSPGTNAITTVATSTNTLDQVNPQLKVTNTFTVTVKEVNVAPVLPVLAAQTVNELTLLTVTNTATDTNAHGLLGYVLLNPPTGMLISTNGIITWTPTQAQSPGTYVISTVATSTDSLDQINPQLSATNSFSVVVKEVNAAPVLSLIATQTVNELTLLTVTNAATDTDQHSTLSYALLNPPAGAAISTNGIITWSPSQAQSPGTNTITTVATSTDNADLVNPQLSVTNSFTVIVKEVNVAPVLPTLAPQTVNELTLLMVTNTATDANVHATVGYALLNPPTGAVISPNGVITWTPGQAQSPGTYTVTTVATGTNNRDQIHPQLSATNSFTVTVEEVNTAPTLPVIATQTVNELTLLTVTNTAGESNVHATNLTYFLLNPPAGAAISTNGIITWTPGQAQSPGTNTITTLVVNDDPYDPADTQLAAVNSFTVIVKEVNAAPVLPVIATQTVTALSTLTVTNTATDTNIHATVTYALVSPPAGMTISSNGIITWMPTLAQAPGTNTITTIATGTDLLAATNPQLSVTNVFQVVVKVSGGGGGIPPALLVNGYANGSFAFSFKTTPGTGYTVEYSTTLTAWTVVQTYVGNGSTITFTDPGAGGNPARFYRVLLAP